MFKLPKNKDDNIHNREPHAIRWLKKLTITEAAINILQTY